MRQNDNLVVWIRKNSFQSRQQQIFFAFQCWAYSNKAWMTIAITTYLLFKQTMHLMAMSYTPTAVLVMPICQVQRFLEHWSPVLLNPLTTMANASHSKWRGPAIFGQMCLYSFCSGKQKKVEVDWHSKLHFDKTRQDKTRLKFRECSFHYYGPAIWNSLVSNLSDVPDTGLLISKYRVSPINYRRYFFNVDRVIADTFEKKYR